MKKPKKRVRYVRLLTEDEKARIGACECGSPLASYVLEVEGERPKDLVCCMRDACDNSAKMTARIHRADLVFPVPAGAEQPQEN